MIPTPVRKAAYKLLLILPVFVAMVGFSVYVDPARLSGNTESDLTDLMLQGNAVQVGNFNERSFLTTFLEAEPEQFDIVLIGSSRSMTINSEMVCNTSFFNASVSGASMEDYVAITQQLKQHEYLPQSVIIGLDPWAFNTNHGQDRWQTNSTPLFDWLLEHPEVPRLGTIDYPIWFNLGILQPIGRRLATTRDAIVTTSELLKIRYFQEAWNFEGTNARQFEIIDPQSAHTVNLKRSDGSRDYGTKTLSVDDAALQAEIANNANTYSLDNFTTLDSTYIALFEALINDLQTAGVTVYIYLPPYHPTAYEKFVNALNLTVITDVESFANGLDVLTLGSYDPAKNGYTSSDFIDAIHPKPVDHSAIQAHFCNA